MQILGIDVGGSGIKGAPVDTGSGVLLAERVRLETPAGAKPAAVAEVVAQIARQFSWNAPIGCGFPAVIRSGVAKSAANISPKWIGTDAARLFSEATNCPVYVVNDADAAGLAEVTFGAGRDVRGVVLVITIGTGLGSALFIDGRLVPNTELGHIEVDCEEAEAMASEAARRQEDLSWKKWARRLDKYLGTLESLFSPDLFILGGGAIKKQDQFIPHLNLRTQLVPAQLGNDAGIVGAALAARRALG